MISSKLASYNLKNQSVIVRIDWNVPLLKGSHFFDETKLTASLSTLKFIRAQGGRPLIITHWGTPERNDPSLSTEHFLPWLFKHGFNPRFAQTPQEALTMVRHDTSHDIIVLENIRFFPQEKALDEQFAHQLFQLGTFFVQDAFGTLHRSDTSMTLLPALFDNAHRTIGFLVETELKKLEAFTDTLKKPLVLIMGGSKISTKLPVIEQYLGKAQTIILLPALAFTFMKAQEIPVGRSLVDEDYIQQAHIILENATQQETEIILPLDWRVSDQNFNDPGNTYLINDFSQSQQSVGISIGPKTVTLIESILKNAHTVFFNGPCGNLNVPNTTTELAQIFKILTHHAGQVLIAGGDSCAAYAQLGFKGYIQSHPNRFSTGGGAVLEYLSGKKLPGLTYFL